MFLLLPKKGCGVIWREKKSLEPKTAFGVFIKLSAESLTENKALS